ncbi:MAG: putative lipid II flippase FtsW [Verrucomicrobiales bacterium]|nr:putative lipid II flippase FtsW [Verrucomicrobiales bacterium]
MHQKSLIMLLSAVSFLVIVGLVMLISTCVFSAGADPTDGYREAKKQGVWLFLGIVLCVWAAMTDYRFWKKRNWLLYGGVVVLLALCFVPGIGRDINGESRWVEIGALRLQPSEFAKIAVITFLAYWFSRHPDGGNHLIQGFGAPLAIVSLPLLLILFEVDIGTTAVLSATTFLILFVAGTNWKYLTGLCLAGVVAFIGMLNYAPNRVERIMAFLDLEKHQDGAGYQQWLALMAIGSGGMTGRGIGEGRLKMMYMPFAHTDFIFPMIGEEMGLIFTILVVLAFVFLVFSGFIIGAHAPDRFGTLLALGLAGYIGFQAFLNIGVTTAILPNTGLTLPFVSYGGSSLLVGFVSIGILINIYRQGVVEQVEGKDWVIRKNRITPRT